MPADIDILASGALSPFGPVNSTILPVEQMPPGMERFGYDLAVTIESGQSFCWRPLTGAAKLAWIGWAGDIPCVAAQAVAGQPLTVFFPASYQPQRSAPASDYSAVAELKRYFQTETPYAPFIRAFPAGDPHLAQAMAWCGGMRILHQPAWETTASFICSAQKQIVQIMQINSALRKAYVVTASSQGENGVSTETDVSRLDHLHPFPHASLLAAHGEDKLRLCKLGFRAKHLHRTALQLHPAEGAAAGVSGGLPSQEEIAALTLAGAVERFTEFHGIGEKVASCILLFAYQRYDAFPVDVWIQRILADLYIRRKKDINPAYIRQFAVSHFGPYAGIAQQILFHWYRNGAPQTVDLPKPTV